jgi:hypothetical protein
MGQFALPSAAVSPPANAEPRTIVTDFLQSNASVDPTHKNARAFLTPEANNRWSASSVTIVDDWQSGIGNPDAENRITVTGNPVGQIDPNGIYTPNTAGGSDVKKSITYTLKKSGEGQWRIDNIQPNGLLISESQFQSYYVQSALYFYDADGQRLVPDPRFSSLRDSSDIESWLMTLLAQGARPTLTPAIQTALPPQTDPRRVTVTPGDIVKVEIPGSAQLPADYRNRLATQVALTLAQPLAGADMTITDGGQPVSIPQVGSAVFSSADFDEVIAPPASPPDLYYINPGGAVINAGTNQPIPGPLGTGSTYHFAAVGLANLANANTDRLLVAGTVGEPGAQTFYVGATTGGLHVVNGVAGTLSRPAWVPHRDEVWVGAGNSLYRVSTSGTNAYVAKRVTFSTGSGKVLSDVAALRFSPEGTRVALVLRSADQGQIWLGSVVRTSDSDSVQVSELTLISPASVSVSDVAWNDPLKLFAVGRNIGGGANVYEVQSDGSLWASRGISNLPPTPDSITVAQNVVAAVSAANTVFVQSRGGGTWVPPLGGTAQGTNPIYVEQ